LLAAAPFGRSTPLRRAPRPLGGFAIAIAAAALLVAIAPAATVAAIPFASAPLPAFGGRGGSRLARGSGFSGGADPEALQRRPGRRGLTLFPIARRRRDRTDEADHGSIDGQVRRDLEPLAEGSERDDDELAD